jgi:putative ABC transport system permease protein
VDSFLHDLRFALRTLGRTPGFLCATVATVALGVGATTALLTVVDRIVLRPLPFPDSDRAVVICETSARTAAFCVASPANVADWGRGVAAIETIGVARSESASIESGGRRVGVPGGIASAGFFKVLNIQPAEGRLLEDDDLHPARNQVVVISDRFWREQLDSQPNVVGRSINLNGRPFRIVGRLPADAYIPSFDFAQVWKPLSASVDNTSDRNWRGFMAIGRLVRGATIRDLDVQLEAARGRLAMAYPESNAGWGVRTLPLRDHVVGSAGATLWLFLAAATLVLVIACANVAGLLLARASTRGPEFAVRLALGAGRNRLIRQLLTESVALAAGGGVLGWLLAAGATRALVGLAPDTIPRLNEVAVDGRVALFAVALTMFTAVAFGLAPAWAATVRPTLSTRLTSSRRTTTGAARTRSAIVVAELALSVVLLLTAGVLTRSFARLLAWDPGFDRTSVTVSWTLVPPAKSMTARSAVEILERIREETASIPGVLGVGLASGGPLFGGTETGVVEIVGQPSGPTDHGPVVNWFDIDPHYFSAVGRRIVKGRDLAATDVEGAPLVAVVNETSARQLFSGVDPVGRLVTVQNHPAEIVGVVADVRPVRPDLATPAEIFWPIRQYPRYGAYLVIRTAPGAPVPERAVQARINAVDPTISAGRFTRLERAFEADLVSPRFNMLLLGSFAIVAIVLAAVGVFGVVAHSVASRKREIGVRIALGATPRGLIGSVLRSASLLGLVGLSIGVAASLALTRILAGFAYGVAVTDPVVLSAAITGLLVVTLVAAYVPARRASRVDPLLALRSE